MATFQKSLIAFSGLQRLSSSRNTVWFLKQKGLAESDIQTIGVPFEPGLLVQTNYLH